MKIKGTAVIPGLLTKHKGTGIRTYIPKHNVRRLAEKFRNGMTPIPLVYDFKQKKILGFVDKLYFVKDPTNYNNDRLMFEAEINPAQEQFVTQLCDLKMRIAPGLIMDTERKSQYHVVQSLDLQSLSFTPTPVLEYMGEPVEILGEMMVETKDVTKEIS